MTKRQVGRCGCELICGQSQKLLQSSEGCNHLCAVQQIQPHFLQTTYGFDLPSFAFAIDDARRLDGCSALLKPIASFPKLSSNDCHRCDLLAATSQDSAKKQMPSIDEHTLNCSCQARHANNLLCESKALKTLPHRREYGVISYAVECLTNLIAHCQGCLLSSVRQYWVFQSKVRSFGSPVGGL